MGKRRVSSPKGQGREWAIMLPVFSFSEIRMSDRARVMLLVLEGMARERSYCWPSNDRLVEITGKCLRSVQDALNDLESPQDPAETRWIKRVFSDPKRRERRGIIMLRRIDPTKPAADSAEAVAKATAAILECDNLHSLHAESHAHSVQKSASELIKNKNNNNLRLQETSNSVAHEITLPVVGWPETTSGEGDVREEATTSESRDACQADLAEQLAKLVDLNGKPARQAVIRIATKVAELLLDDHSVKKHCQLLGACKMASSRKRRTCRHSMGRTGRSPRTRSASWGRISSGRSRRLRPIRLTRKSRTTVNLVAEPTIRPCLDRRRETGMRRPSDVVGKALGHDRGPRSDQAHRPAVVISGSGSPQAGACSV